VGRAGRLDKTSAYSSCIRNDCGVGEHAADRKANIEGVLESVAPGNGIFRAAPIRGRR
jgi:hypothetical protein